MIVVALIPKTLRFLFPYQTVTRFAAAAGCAAILHAWPAMSQVGAPYREPNFSRPLFDVDALSLSGGDREAIVEALAAAARNFSRDPAMATETREKALAIALRLDSMNPSARLANDRLIAGESPPPADEFQDKAAISEILWKTAVRLFAAKSEPEDARLVPYLMELALLIAPDTSEQRLPVFRSALPANQQESDWKAVLPSRGVAREEAQARGGGAAPKATREKPGGDASNAERSLPAGAGPQTAGPPAGGAMRGEGGGDAMVAEAGQGSATAAPREEGQASSSAGPIALSAGVQYRLQEARVPMLMVFEGNGEQEDGPVIVEVTGRVEPWEQALEGLPVFCEEGIGDAVTQRFPVIAEELRQRHPAFPRAHRVRLTLESFENGNRKALESGQTVTGIALVMDALMSGVEPDRGFIVSGLVGPALQDDAAGMYGPEMLEAARDAGHKAVVLEASAERLIIDHLIADGPALLFQIQAFGVSGLGDVLPIIRKDRDANVQEAIDLFREIQGLVGRNTVESLVANRVVHERFEKILSLAPQHLGARLLLACGRGELPQKLTLRGSVVKIDRVLKPIEKLIGGETAIVTGSSSETLSSEAAFKLRRLRTLVDSGAVDYCDAATDFAEALKKSANSRTLGGEAVQARSRLEVERSRLRAILDGPGAAN